MFIEDDADLQPKPRSVATPAINGRSTPTFAGAIVPHKSGKIDVYHMIVDSLLGTLRAGVKEQVSAESPFSTNGTRPILDIDGLQKAFTQANILQISTPPRRRNSAAGLLSSMPVKAAPPQADMTLKITKAGLLSRKGALILLDKADK